MKNLVTGAVLLLALAAGCTPNLYKQQKQYFPNVLTSYHFGMSLNDFKALNDDAVEQTNDDGKPSSSFRRVFIDETPFGPYESTVYYFDNEGTFPLYEFIVNYDNEEIRDAWIEKNLGAPNHPNGTEWLFDSGLGYEINIWKFKTKLVLAAAIAGSEWDENRDGKIDATVE